MLTINPSPTTYLIKTIRGSDRVFIYYDPDIFTEKILISASLLIGEDQIPFDYHYNTIHDEISDGTNFEILDDITIKICPLPIRTEIIGESRIDINSEELYNITPLYDTENLYTYKWETTNGTIIGNDNEKELRIIFDNNNITTLSLTITNPCGCQRVIYKILYPGTKSKKILVLRNTYF